MSNSLFGVFLIVLILTGHVLGALGFGMHLYAISELTGGVYGSRLDTYADYNLGLSVRYPSDVPVDKQYYYDWMGENKKIQGVAFAIPESKLKGTNLLSGTQASVEIIPNIPSCNARLFLSDPNEIRSFIENDVLYSSDNFSCCSGINRIPTRFFFGSFSHYPKIFWFKATGCF